MYVRFFGGVAGNQRQQWRPLFRIRAGVRRIRDPGRFRTTRVGNRPCDAPFRFRSYPESFSVSVAHGRKPAPSPFRVLCNDNFIRHVRDGPQSAAFVFVRPGTYRNRPDARNNQIALSPNTKSRRATRTYSPPVGYYFTVPRLPSSFVRRNRARDIYIRTDWNVHRPISRVVVALAPVNPSTIFKRESISPEPSRGTGARDNERNRVVKRFR